ncbi:CLUMA_CG014689, isoform A [Clunio marinus]|uniref:CLUMA_CG014689, isoform A n=1 Tax=Clunio marinus TaxID=568069 RepID=A0A1J1IQ90_9DIPT|nr:CLUMA_CG014689, isoform A [Clunio marinus]
MYRIDIMDLLLLLVSSSCGVLNNSSRSQNFIPEIMTQWRLEVAQLKLILTAARNPHRLKLKVAAMTRA